jgi:hypothetical protein
MACFGFFLCPPAFAEDTLKLQVNNDILTTLNVESIQGQSMVPVKNLSRITGAVLKHQDNSTIWLTKNGITVELRKNSAAAVKNGVESQLPVAPYIKNNRLYVPLRPVCDLLELPIAWDAALGRVILKNQEARNGKTAGEIFLECSQIMDDLSNYRFDSQSQITTRVNDGQPASVNLEMTEWVQTDPFALKIRQTAAGQVYETYMTDTQICTRENEGVWEVVTAPVNAAALQQNFDLKSDPRQAMDHIRKYGVAYSFSDDLIQEGKRYYVVNACLDAASFKALMDSTAAFLTDNDEKDVLDQWMNKSSFEMYYTIYINQDTMMQEVMTYSMDISVRMEQDKTVYLNGSGTSLFSTDALFEKPALP